MELRFSATILQNGNMIPYGRVDAVLIEKIAKWCWETGNHA